MPTGELLLQVIGLCRFSYLGTGAFKVGYEDPQDQMEYLFSDERLDERFRFFETFTLPGLREQFDPDFTFLIVTSDRLPDAARARLERLVADIPQAVIQAHPPGPHRAVMRTAVNSVRLFDCKPCLQFRLDDDDAVAISFVHKLRAAANSVAGLLEEHPHVAIDFNQGYTARPGPDGIDAAKLSALYLGVAFGVLFRPRVERSILDFSHNKIYRKMPTVTFTGEDMFVRGLNAFNDSRTGPNTRPVPLSPLDANGELRFQMAFNIDADHVRRVFRRADIRSR